VRNVVHVNYEIDDDLHMRVKAAAAMRGMTLKAYVMAALEKALDDEPPAPPRRAAKKAAKKKT
jgi:predicted DNA binding CopG/RHH family protein